MRRQRRNQGRVARLEIRLAPGEKLAIVQHARAQGVTFARWVMRAVREQMEKERSR